MYYQVIVRDIGDNDIKINQTQEQTLGNHICPFINREITLQRGEIFNMAFPYGMRVYQTSRPITKDWPINVDEFLTDSEIKPLNDDTELHKRIDRILILGSYKDKVIEKLNEIGTDVTEKIFKEAIKLMETGDYRDIRRRIIEDTMQSYSFFICPFDNEEVDENFQFAVRPIMEKRQFKIERANEIASSKPVTDVITNAIIRSKLIIADLTDERPNCYYEVGFAHALGKPVIIIAKEGTPRHFDIAVYNYHYWKNFKHLWKILENAVDQVINEISK